VLGTAAHDIIALLRELRVSDVEDALFLRFAGAGIGRCIWVGSEV